MGVPIIIVGGGPVGLALALILGRYGVRTVVLEARERPTPPDESRAITWMPRGLELLDWLGLGREFARAGVRRTAHEFWASGRRLLTLRFDEVESEHGYTLQLPQHQTEVLLERACLQTGLTEVRRGHRVVGLGQTPESVSVTVEGPAGRYRLAARWGVGCDGARSTVRQLLGVGQRWRDYGASSVVADFEMSCDLDPGVSTITLDPRRPHGFFCFAPRRWRLVYRVNRGEDRDEAAGERAAASLLLGWLPGARVGRFLWGSAFRLGQGQSEEYRSGRWLLAGDAAHAMGPSAGAGMMTGLLGAWRLGWRLALAAEGHALASYLLDDYGREQREGAEQIQGANAMIFRNMAVENRLVAAARSVALRAAASLPGFARRLTETEALLRQRLPVAGAADGNFDGPWRDARHVGLWRVGERMPYAGPADARKLVRLSHALFAVGGRDPGEELKLARAVKERAPFEIDASALNARLPELRDPSEGRPCLALVRPDQQVVKIIRSERRG